MTHTQLPTIITPAPDLARAVVLAVPLALLRLAVGDVVAAAQDARVALQGREERKEKESPINNFHQILG